MVSVQPCRSTRSGRGVALALPLVWSVLALGLGVSPAVGQVLNVPWVREADERVEAVRTAGMRVVVLDADDRAVPGAAVRIRQLGHAFAFGLPADVNHRGMARELARCFSALSLGSIGPGSSGHDADDVTDEQGVDRAVDAASGPGMRSPELASRYRWLAGGPLVRFTGPSAAPDADATRLAPDLGAIEQSVRGFGRQLDSITVAMLERSAIAPPDPLGVHRLRELCHRVRAAVPGQHLTIAYDASLSGPDTRLVAEHVTRMREAFVPVDTVAMNGVFDGMVVHQPLQRTLDWLERLGVRVVVQGLEVSGPTPEAAAINIETVLRTLFSHPVVTGIYVAATGPDEVTDPNAALCDGQGGLTPAGRVFVNLVGGQWWVDRTVVTDRLGGWRGRVMAGGHELSVDLPDGDRAAMVVHLEPGESEDLIVLQPSSAGAGEPTAGEGTVAGAQH
jgi:hypothetical protein